MSRFFFTCFFMLASVLGIQAQSDEICVSADRPGMATGAGVLDQGVVQWETGLEFGVGDEKYISLPTTMVRWGLTQFAEIRLQFDGAMNKSDKWEYSVLPLTLGTKIKVFDGYKAVPQVSLMANLSIPSTKTQRDEIHVAPQLYLLCHNDINDWLALDYNVGEEWNGQNNIPSTFLALCMGFTLTDKFGAFAESYNYVTKGDEKTVFDPNVDFGFTYTPCRRLQLDTYAGFNLKEPKSAPYIGCGVAWLF